MADKVLTTGSIVNCPHGFGITFASTAALTVGGHAVVRQSDLLTTVPPCTDPQQKCTKIQGFKLSTIVHDGGSPVVLVTGLSTNIGPCTVGDAGHDLLQTD